MSRIRQEISSVQFQIDARKANASMDALQEKAKDLNKDIEKTQADIKALGDVAPDNKQLLEFQKTLRGLTRDLNDVTRAQNELIKGVKAADKLWKAAQEGNIESLGVKSIKAGQRGLQQRMQSLQPGDEADAKVLRAYKAVIEEADIVMLKFKTDAANTLKILDEGGSVSARTMRETRDNLKELVDITPKATAEYKEFKSQLDQMESRMSSLSENERRLAGEIVTVADAMKMANASTREAAEQRLKDAAAAKQQAETERATLETQREASRLKIETAEKEAASIKEQITEQEKLVKSQEALYEASDRADKEVDEARKKRDAARESTKQYTDAITKAANKVADLKKQLEELNGTPVKPQVDTSELDRLKAKLESIEREIKEAEAESEKWEKGAPEGFLSDEQIKQEIIKRTQKFYAEQLGQPLRQESISAMQQMPISELLKEGYSGKIRQLDVFSDLESMWKTRPGAIDDRIKKIDGLRQKYNDVVQEIEKLNAAQQKAAQANQAEGEATSKLTQLQEEYNAKVSIRIQKEKELKEIQGRGISDDPHLKQLQEEIAKLEELIAVSDKYKKQFTKMSDAAFEKGYMGKTGPTDDERKSVWRAEEYLKRAYNDRLTASVADHPSVAGDPRYQEAAKRVAGGIVQNAQENLRRAIYAEIKDGGLTSSAIENRLKGYRNQMAIAAHDATGSLKDDPEYNAYKYIIAQMEKYLEVAKQVEAERAKIAGGSPFLELAKEKSVLSDAPQEGLTRQKESREFEEATSGSDAINRRKEQERIKSEEVAQAKRDEETAEHNLNEEKKKSAEVTKQLADAQAELDKATKDAEEPKKKLAKAADDLTEAEKKQAKAYEDLNTAREKQDFAGQNEKLDQLERQYDELTGSIEKEKQALTENATAAKEAYDKETEAAIEMAQAQNYSQKSLEDSIALLEKQSKVETDPKKYKEMTTAIETMQQRVKEMTGEWMSYAEAEKYAESIGTDGFIATSDQLQKATQSLTRYKDTLIKTIQQKRDDGKATAEEEAELKKVETELKKMKFEMDNANMSSKRMHEILKDPKSAKNIEELSAAIKRSTQELKLMEETIGKDNAKYKEMAEQTKKATIAQKEMEAQFKASSSAFEKAWSRLKTYVGLYVGAAVAMQKIVATMGDLMELSDKMGEVRKTTGFTADEVGRLSDNLKKLDVRTSLTSLMELSSLAGSVGLKTQQDVQGFTEAANQLLIALPEMGNESARTLIKIAQATGDLQKNGGDVRETLEKVGSTIIALRANSASAAGPITDFVSRVGAVGAQAGISIDQIAALGSTIDALGGRVEMSATALSRMIPAIRNNSYAIANSIGVTESYLKSLSAMDQMVLIFQKLRDSIKGINTETEEGQQQMADNIEAVLGKNAVMAEVMKDLNQQGARAGIVFGLLSQNVDELQKQLGIAGEAYKDNIALQEEFNKMNDTTAAKWARLKNQLEEMFVSDSAQRTLGTIIDGLRKIVDLISMDGPLGKALRYIGTYLAFMKIGWTEAFGKAMISVYKWTQSTEASTAATIADTAAKEANATATTKQGEASEVAAKKTTMLGKAWGKMSDVMKANVITAAAMALWYLVNALMATIEKARQAEEAISRVKEKTDAERESVDKLFKPLEKVNLAEAEKSKLISEINSKYGSYLSKMLTEASNAQEIARAYEAINLQLERKNTLEGMEENKKRVEEGRRKELDSAFAELDRLVMSGAVSQTEGAQLSADITGIIKKGIEDGLNKAEIRTKIGEMLQGKAEGGSIKDRMLVSGQGRADWVETQKTLQGAAMEYYETQLSVQNEIKTANKRLQADMDNIVGNVRKAAEKDIPNLVKGLNSAMSKGTDAKKYTDKESGAVVEAFNAIKAYYDLHREDLTDEQRKKLTDALTTDIKAFRDKYNTASGGNTNPYGNFNRVTSPYGDWDADSLVARRKEMLERVRSLANGADVQKVLSEDAKFISEAVRNNIKTTKDAIEWYNAERLKIQDALHERYLTNTGDWMDPKKDGKKASRMVQDEMKYYLDELDAYYTERKAMIQQERNDEQISEGEAWRQTLLIEAEWQQRRGELQQLYGTRREKVAKEETAAILDILSERTEETTDYIKKDIENTVKFIERVGSEKGKAAMDKIYGDIDLGSEKAYLRQRNAIGKQVQFMADTLAKERPFNGITENLQENLTKMGILVGQVPEKMHFLLGQIEDAYTLDVKEMVKRISEAGFKEWADQISGDTQVQQALLAQLRQAYEAVQEGIRKEATRIKKDADMMWKLMLMPDGTNLKQAADEALASLTQRQESVSRANSLIGAGTASENVVTRLAIKQLQLQQSVQQAQYALMKKMGEEKAQYLDQLAKEYEAQKDLKKAERARIDAANVRKSIELSVTEETKKQADLNKQIAKLVEESQNRLYTSLREWAEVLSSGLQGVFEASNSGNAEYYNKRAVLEAEGSFLTKSKKTVSTTTSDKGTSAKTTVSTTTPLQDYYIIENAGTSEAKARKESLTELEYLEKQHEIEQYNARMEAWKKLMDDLNMKMNEQITDWINASLQNASVDANTAALGLNTEAIKAMTEQISGKTAEGGATAEAATNPTEPSDWMLANEGVGELDPSAATQAKIDASAAAKDAIVQDQKDIQQSATKANKEMVKSSKASFAAMTAAANMYGIAYQTMANENLTTAQKVEMLIVQAAGQAAISMLTATMAASTGETAANMPAWVSKTLKELGPIGGPVAIGVFTALIGGLMGMAVGKIAKSKSEIAAATGAGNSVASGRLATGMLTYAEGNVNELSDPSSLTVGRSYNVDGADGKTYRAKYMGKGAKTHITNGPEFHLVGEAGQEAIIDAKTTRLIRMDDNGIWKAIQTLYNGGSIKTQRRRSVRRGIPAFADGNIDDFEEITSSFDGGGNSGMSMEMAASLQSSIDRQSELLERALSEGIKGVFNVYGPKGLIDSYDTGKKTAQRYGQKY